MLAYALLPMIPSNILLISNLGIDFFINHAHVKYLEKLMKTCRLIMISLLRTEVLKIMWSSKCL